MVCIFIFIYYVKVSHKGTSRFFRFLVLNLTFTEITLFTGECFGNLSFGGKGSMWKDYQSCTLVKQDTFLCSGRSDDPEGLCSQEVLVNTK